MKHIYYERSRLHLLNIVARLKSRAGSRLGLNNDAVVKHMVEKLQELDKTVECLNHRLDNWKATH